MFETIKYKVIKNCLIGTEFCFIDEVLYVCIFRKMTRTKNKVRTECVDARIYNEQTKKTMYLYSEPIDYSFITQILK